MLEAWPPLWAQSWGRICGVDLGGAFESGGAASCELSFTSSLLGLRSFVLDPRAKRTNVSVQD